MCDAGRSVFICFVRSSPRSLSCRVLLYVTIVFWLVLSGLGLLVVCFAVGFPVVGMFVCLCIGVGL